MNLRKVKSSLTIALFALTSMSAMAQDVIAHQAPSDKRLRDVHAIKLNKTLDSNADLNNPASDIYTNWTNNTWTVEGHVPANYKIDLRGFCMPTSSRVLTSNFGRRWGKQHQGLDIKVYIGDTIRAAFDGKVRVVTCEGLRKGYGYYIVIRHPNGLETLYGHLSKQLVKEDQIVRAGDVIGLGGNTGKSTGSHLHFETRLLGQPINPALLFDFVNQDVTGDFYVSRKSMTKGMSKSDVDELERINAINDMAMAISSAEESRADEGATAEESEEAATEVQEVEATPTRASKKSSKRNKATATHRVKNGDSLYSIARRNGTTVDKLLKLNGLKSNSVIRKGQVIRVS